MMERKLCFTFIVILIDSLHAEEIQIDNQGINNNNSFLILEHHCGSNEILNSNKKICELTCNVPTPLLRCLKQEASACICSEGYVRNDIKKCVALSECPPKISSEKILSVDTIFNWTQNANLEENQNITLLNSGKIVRNFQEHLSRQLNTFLHSLRSRMPTNSGRNVRHTDENVPHDYQHYMSRLRASSGQVSGPEFNL